ncbi:MAG: pantoate--beta-alanine ligase [Actinobacteria bacterium]|nr:pantoate--beta-alanine ligase [Actinomycetota bacterium]
MMTTLFTELGQYKRWRDSLDGSAVVGFVPTMGALHEGHINLMQRAKRECDVVVVSIYVNDLQFNSQQDFDRYPRTLSLDINLCNGAEVDVVIAPNKTDLFPHNAEKLIEPSTSALGYEGRDRPGHFAGVTTIVDALFSSIRPTNVFLGLKDYQQVCVIRDMAAIKHPEISIIPCNTVRDHDGLALSSRNRFLTKNGRENALHIPHALHQVNQLWNDGMHDVSELELNAVQLFNAVDGVDLQYVSIVEQDSMRHATVAREHDTVLIAAIVEGIRLIDNVQLLSV